MKNYTNLRSPLLQKNKVMKCISSHFSSLHPREVELFKQIVDGKIKENGIDEELIRDAFPGLLREPPKPEKKAPVRKRPFRKRPSKRTSTAKKTTTKKKAPIKKKTTSKKKEDK